MAFKYTVNPTIHTTIDGTFEGGGTLGSAYIGTLMALHRRGIWFERVAGNSAGAITAAMIAVGYNANEIDWLTAPEQDKSMPFFREKPDTIDKSLKPISFSAFMDRPATNDIQTRRNSLLWHALKGTIADEVLKLEVTLPPLDAYITGAATKIFDSIARSLGPLPMLQGLQQMIEGLIQTAFKAYPQKTMLKPLSLLLTEAQRTQFANHVLDAILDQSPDACSIMHLTCDGSLLKGDAFLNIIRRILKAKCWGDPAAARDVTFADLPKDLVVIAANITKSAPIIYSKLRSPSFSVAEAVRQSMSVPFFFEPRTSQGDEIVDGGIIENFPWWVFFPIDPGYPLPGAAPVLGDTKFRFAIADKSTLPNLKWPSRLPSIAANNGIVATSAVDIARAKIAFSLDDYGSCPPSYQCPPGPWANKTEQQALDESLAESHVFDFDFGALGPVGSAFKRTAEAKLVERLMQINRSSTNTLVMAAAVGFAMELYPNFYHQSIPMKGFFWLDFTVNDDIAKFNSSAARGWEAANELIQNKQLAASTGSVPNPYR